MKFTIRYVKHAGCGSRVDFDRGLLVFRKPRVFNEDRDDADDFTYVQRKSDGVRVLAVRMPSGLLAVYTTTGDDLVERYTHVVKAPWFVACSTAELSAGQLVDAELYVPGRGREAVKTTLVKQPESTRLAVFGCTAVPLESPLGRLNDWCRSAGLDCLEYARLTDHVGAETIQQVTDGSDGIVFKTSMYGDWAKRKNCRTVDAVVTRIVPGVGEHWGKCGSLEVSVYEPERDVHLFGPTHGTTVRTATYHVVARCGSGMDQSVRDAISSDDIGRVCEVAYERVGSKGRLQHPRFIGWRDDKAAEACTLDQDPKLVEYYSGSK